MKERFCPSCGDKLTDKGVIGQLVDKACPSSRMGEVVYIQKVIHIVCKCGFVSIFVNEK